MNRFKKIFFTGMLATLTMLSACGIANPKQEEELQYRQQGIEALQSGEYEEAVELFQKALDNANGRIGEIEMDICYYKAYAQILSGDMDGAKTTYDALIDYDDANGNAYLLRGNLHLLSEDIDAACKDYDKAIQCEGKGYELYIYAYEQLKAFGYAEQGEEYLNRALELKSKTKEEYRERGKIHIILGNYAEAKEALSNAQNLGDEESKLYMAQVLELEGDLEAAAAIYENYAKLHEGDAYACEQLARVFLEAGRYEDVLVYVELAKDAGDLEDEASLLKCEIIAYEQMGNYEKARQLLASYLEKYPEDAQAQKELLFLNTR